MIAQVQLSGGAGTSTWEVSPGGFPRRWRLVGIGFRLTTDATVANRLVRVVIKDGAGSELFSLADALQTTASVLNRNHSLVPGTAASGNIGYTRISHVCPPLELEENWTATLQIDGGQAGDTVENIQAIWRQVL